jgi:hypothetical protein
VQIQPSQNDHSHLNVRQLPWAHTFAAKLCTLSCFFYPHPRQVSRVFQGLWPAKPVLQLGSVMSGFSKCIFFASRIFLRAELCVFYSYFCHFFASSFKSFGFTPVAFPVVKHLCIKHMFLGDATGDSWKPTWGIRLRMPHCHCQSRLPKPPQGDLCFFNDFGVCRYCFFLVCILSISISLTCAHVGVHGRIRRSVCVGAHAQL